MDAVEVGFVMLPKAEADGGELLLADELDVIPPEAGSWLGDIFKADALDCTVVGGTAG